MTALVKRMFTKYPVISNSIVYGSLFVSAEFSQQTVTKKFNVKNGVTEPYDLGALGRYAFYGTAVQSNILYYWYRWLDKTFAGTATKTIVKKVLVDQFVLTPPLLVVFYLSMSVMERKIDIFEECKHKFLPTFETSCLFWMPMQTLNFCLVPPVARVVYVGTCALIWVNILCYLKRQKY